MSSTQSRAARRMFFLTTTLLAGSIGGIAFAQETVQPAQDNTDVTDSAVKTIIVKAERSKAAANSPSKASLDQGQPQSIVSRPFIELATPETADYTSIANVTPSASTAGSPNGAGYGEAKLTLRGFSDAQYNVTYDAIPWGDTNGPSHHSNSFFPASTVGAVIVDRGPGVAGDLGQVSFGGNVKMFSNKVSDDFGITLRETVGSWNSWQSVAVLQTGKMQNLGGLAGFINVQANASDGQQTFSGMHSNNFTAKFVLPLGETWNLTFFGTANHNKWNKSDNDGATLAQVALYGKNFNLSNDPTKATFTGYNNFIKDTNFSYIKLAGDLPLGIKFDNTAYNYYYNNNTDTARELASADGTTNAPTAIGTYVTNSLTVNGALTTNKASNLTDISGYNKLNHYMVWGDIARFSREFSIGTLRLGIWLEGQKTKRHTYDYDATLGRNVKDNREKPVCLVYGGITGTTCVTTSTDAYLNSIAYEERSSWTQTEIFADFEWHPTEALTITPGLKNLTFTREVAAPVIASPRKAQYAADTFTKTLEFFTVNYKLAKNWSVYSQYATGFQVPSLNSLYVINPSLNTAEPSQSTNYQLGTVYQSKHVAVDLDVYRVDTTNLLAADSTGISYINVGKAKYNGVEGQVSYAFDNGVTLYANHSINRAKNAATGLTLANSPKSTTGFGVLYKSGNWAGALLYKQVGEQFMKADETLPVKAYETIDASAAYTFGRYQLKAQISNLLDKRPVVSIKTGSSAALDKYFYQSGVNAQLTLIAKF